MIKYLLFGAFLVTIGLNNLFAQTTFNISNKIRGDTLLTIDNNGNMGIGLQIPEARLDLKLTDPWAW
jgi:hypothetical protein